MRLLIDQLLQHTAARPDDIALLLPRAERIETLTWTQLTVAVAGQVYKWQTAGYKPGAIVVTQLGNTLHWIVRDLAALSMGLVHVPIPVEISPARCNELLSSLQPVETAVNDESEQLLAESRTGDFAASRKLLTECIATRSPDELATIVYTSGTTGIPVGVELTQGNLASNANALAEAFADEPTGRRLCWLPLVHLYARTADLYCWLVRGSQLVLNNDRERITSDARLTKPELINGVPYFFDRLRRHVIEQKLPATEQGPYLRRLLGGNIRLLISGGAPLPNSLQAFFAECGLSLVSGYGLTEAGPVVATETLTQRAAGSVGKPLPGVQVTIADDGEVLVAGAGIARGYFRAPELQAKRFTSDGRLHTGDAGYLDAKGYLYISGRIKDVLVLSTGHKLSPQAIETELLDLSLIQQALIIGEGRPYPVALLVPNPQALRGVIRERRLWVWSKRRALTHPTIRAILAEQIAARLAHRPAHEQIKRWALIGRGWTPESGELTASLKMKRGEIERNFAREIARLYD